MLIIEPVEHGELLLAVSRISSRIKIDDDVRGPLLSSSHKDVDQQIIHRVDAFDLIASHFKNDVAFFNGFLSFASCERMQKSIDGGSAGERFIFTTWIFADNGFKERIVSQQLSIVAIRIAGQNLIDLLCEDVFGGMGECFFGSRIGHPSSGFSENAEFEIEFANREQPGIADDLPAIKSHRDLLPTDFKKLQLLRTLCLRHSNASRAS